MASDMTTYTMNVYPGYYEIACSIARSMGLVVQNACVHIDISGKLTAVREWEEIRADSVLSKGIEKESGDNIAFVVVLDAEDMHSSKFDANSLRIQHKASVIKVTVHGSVHRIVEWADYFRYFP